MFSDEIMNAELFNITEWIRDVNNMLSPLNKRIEEFRQRDDLFKVTSDRFLNFTKEVEKI